MDTFKAEKSRHINNGVVMELEWLLRILFSAVIGGVIGYERHNRAKEAGVRTHSIVALASAMMMIISKYGFMDAADFDAARIAAQIITGISFLGAGIIFVRNDTIQGLTTAAGIWATAGIGMAIGAGMYLVGTFAGLLIIAIQTILHRGSYMTVTRVFMNLKVMVNKDFKMKAVVERLDQENMDVDDIHISPVQGNDTCWSLTMAVSCAKPFEPEHVMELIRKTAGVQSVTMQ